MNIDTKQLTADIKSIKGRAKTLDGDIQSAALRAIQIADKAEGTGNLHFVNALYKALGKGARHQALTSWYLAFGGLKANTSASKEETPFVHDSSKQMDLAEATANPWFDMAPSKKPDETFDVLALAMAMLKKKPKEGQEAAHMALRDRLVGVVDEYRATLETEPAAAGGDQSNG